MDVQRLVIHCTDTPEGREVTAADIRAWHTSPPPKGRGWKQVGYTDMIHLDGSLERLVSNNEDSVVDPWEVTNGAEGYNSTSRHIVYVGGQSLGDKTPRDTRTAAQKDTLATYVKYFHLRNPKAQIIGHHDLNPGKACPSFDVKAWLKTIGINQ